MLQENIEILRRATEVFETGDLERWVSEFFDPEIEWRTSVEDPDAATHRGREALKRYVEQWMESFEGLHAETEQYIDVGDDRIFTWVRWTGRGRASGVDADWYLAIIYTLRDGKVVRGEEYFDRTEALETVGLSEQPMSQESIEIARQGVEQFNQQFNSTEELDLGFLAPDFTLDNSNAAFDAAVYRGHDGAREFMSLLRGMWKLQQMEPQEYIPVGEDRVIVPIRLVSVGRGDVETVAHGATIVTIRERKITHMKAFQSKADALEAVGLTEQDAHADPS